MTNQEAIDQLADITGLGKSPRARERINSAIRRALGAINLMGPFWFTQKTLDINLTSGKSQYVSKTELWKGKRIKRIDDKMSFSDSREYIKVHGFRTFENRARGNTTSGRPTIARLHGSNQMFEFFPIPDDNYTVYVNIHFYLDSIKDLPGDVVDIALDKAALFLITEAHPYFNVALENWRTGRAMLSKKQRRLTHWRDNRIKQDPFGIGVQGTRERQGRRRRGDSGDLLP